MKTFNIKPSDAKYFIDEEKRTVICVIENTKYLFNHFCNDNFKLGVQNIVLWRDKSDFFEKLNMPNRFVGQATCSKDDEWNVETGKLIAFSRAKDKVNKSFFKRANTYINTLDQWVNDAAEVLNQVGEKLSINTERRYNLIESIVGGKPEDGLPTD